MHRSMPRIVTVLLTVLLVGALLPATASAAHPPSVTWGTCEITTDSTGWRLTASVSWEFVPGGTFARGYARVHHDDPVYWADYYFYDTTWIGTSTKKRAGSGTLTVKVVPPNVGPGDNGYLVLGFFKNGFIEKSIEKYSGSTNCGVLPSLPS